MTTRYTIDPEGTGYRVTWRHPDPEPCGWHGTLEGARRSLWSLVRCEGEERLYPGAIEEYRHGEEGV